LLLRSGMLQAIKDLCPWFLAYALACYGSPVKLVSSDGIVLPSCEGVQQGDPCGPLFFAVAISILTRWLGTVPEVWSVWFLDDGHLAGPRAVLHDLLPVLEAKASTLGLSLNREKCAVYLPSGEPLAPDFFPGIPRVSPDTCLPVLGSPVGDHTASLAWVQQKVLEPLTLALSRLESLGDPRAASMILRQCFSACKLNYIMRTAAPIVAGSAADIMDPLLRACWGNILGHVCSDAEWALSSLPIRLGGAGITSPSTVCAAAALSSWLSACSDAPPGLPILAPDGLASCVTHLATVAPALGIPLRDATSGSADPVQALRRHALLPQWRDQSAWSEELFKVRAASFDSAVSERLMGLRRAQSSSGAGLWLTAPIMGGPAFSAVEWQLLLRLRSGAPCFPTSASCNGCGSQMDAMGDHALCCAHNGMYRRHNHIRDTLFHLSASAHWNPALEQALPGTSTRPADILLRGLSVKPVAVDVTVTHPLRLSASVAVRVGTVSAAAESERHKVSVNKVACAAAGWDFLPFGVDALGGLGPSARSLCQKLAKHLAMQAGASTSSTALSVGQHISLALAKGRGEMLSAASPVRPGPLSV
jgi:hypothetical protein